ncbi:hypothetical protein L7F22_045027 [Adiantum nelumboides]|nr:hypothetical protein [Adiantum nelumboides]
MESCCSQQRLAPYVSASSLPCAHYGQQDDEYFTSTQLINAAALNLCDNLLDQHPFFNDKSPLWTATDTNYHQSKLNHVDANCGHVDNFASPAFDSFEQMYKDNYTQLLDIITQFGAGTRPSNGASDLDHDDKLYDYIDVSAKQTEADPGLSLAQAELAPGWHSTASHDGLQKQYGPELSSYGCAMTDTINAEEEAWAMNAAGPLQDRQKVDMMMKTMMRSAALNGAAAAAGGHDLRLQTVCCSAAAESSDDIYESALMTNTGSSINITDDGRRAGLLIETDNITSHIVVKRELGECGRMINELPVLTSDMSCSSESMKSMTPSRKRGRQFVSGQRKRLAGAPEGHGSAVSDKHRDDDVVLVRARRGQATDSHSLAERVRREKIRQRMKLLQELVPGCTKVLGKAAVLEEIINYVKCLQHQIDYLSMRLAANTNDNNYQQQRFHF